MLKKVETQLACSRCGQQTAHIVVYLNDDIFKVTCENCGKDYNFYQDHPLEHYMCSTARQFLREPARLNQEFQEKGPSFLFSLPRRMITKPYRLAQELSEFWRLQSED